MEPYAWVSQGSITKFHRAVKFLKDQKLPVTEEAVKELYVKYAGLVMEEEVAAEPTAAEEDKPVRRGRPVRDEE